MNLQGTSQFIDPNNSVGIGSVTIGGAGFGYTRQNLPDLSGSRYTLVGIAGDESPSVAGFIRQIEGAVRDSVIGLQASSRAAQVMLATSAFSDVVREVHGYLELPSIDAARYINAFAPKGGTAIEDASIMGLRTMAHFAHDLREQDFKVNGVQIVITDGESNSGTFRNAGPAGIGKAKDDALHAEELESLITILVGVNVSQGSTLNSYLSDLKDKGKFDHYVALPDATPATIAKLVGIISKSVSSSSQSLGTGAAPSLSF